MKLWEVVITKLKEAELAAKECQEHLTKLLECKELKESLYGQTEGNTTQNNE